MLTVEIVGNNRIIVTTTNGRVEISESGSGRPAGKVTEVNVTPAKDNAHRQVTHTESLDISVLMGRPIAIGIAPFIFERQVMGEDENGVNQAEWTREFSVYGGKPYEVQQISMPFWNQDKFQHVMIAHCDECIRVVDSMGTVVCEPQVWGIPF